MPDYGHELAFGTFLTPHNKRPDDVVALAQLTERVGLDLATFQDHPYQPAFLDAWTLMSWVAAQTDTLRVAPNVLNLPLRQPAVIARSAASLDLLSGGRVELALGAGAFWDAIEAMGGPRRTPGEAVDALSEAIEVIRGIWDIAQSGGVRMSGEHYLVQGAKRGPEPAHEMEIWLGGLKPRMLRLIGRKADGWLPSLSYLSMDDLAPSNRTIDDAATAAGRDPREIRRLLNIQGRFGLGGGFLQGSPEQWTRDLLPLITDHGFSTFILAGDDPAAIEIFGHEVAPALREAADRDRRAAGTVSGPVRGPRALAQRVAQIDYQALPESLAETAVEPGDKAYGKVRSTYIRSGSPGLVLLPAGVDEVTAALSYARSQDVPLSVRSGGHGISGRSTNDGGIVIDLRKLNQVEVLDPATGRVRLGPGARWSEVAQGLSRYGLGMSSGDYGDVGVGGLATTGGMGFLGRKHGLTIDHVTAAELVLADGSLVRADADEHPDLFWAVRGAGGNFGIVTAVELEAYPVGDVVFSRMAFEASADLLEDWAQLVEQAPRELTSFLTIIARRRDRPIAQLSNVYAGEDTQAATSALAPLLGAGHLLDQQAHLVPYPAILAPQGALHVSGTAVPAFRSGLVNHVSGPIARSVITLLNSGDAPYIVIRSAGGAINDVDPQATAYAHRHQNFAISTVGADLQRLNTRWDEEMGQHVDGLYLSFDTDTRPERLHEAFPAPTLDRLRELKATYDPDNVFNQNFAIPPARLMTAA